MSYPTLDSNREARIVGAVCDLLHDATAATEAKVRGWIGQVLRKAAVFRRWWFLDRLFEADLAAGDDRIDLTGAVDRVITVYAPAELVRRPLSEVLDFRQQAAADNRPNAGLPRSYALEAGRRIHLWPCPDRPVAFAVLYSRPLTVDFLPDEWEIIVMDGVLAFFGQHFDRDALTQNMGAFETRFWQGLATAAVDAHASMQIKSWPDRNDATSLSARNPAAVVLEVPP